MMSDEGTRARHTDWWTDARFGMFIHWGLYAIPARGEWVRSKEMHSDEHYRPYAREFNPTDYDPKAWAALARRAGMKYAVMTAKHHDGFCLFDTKLTSFNATKTLREDESATGRPCNFDRYLDYMHAQVRELLTGYGHVDLLWFDFSYDDMSGETWRAAELVRTARELQPHIVLNNRLSNRQKSIAESMQFGDYHTPEQFIPSEGCTDEHGNAVLWETCMTLNNHWGYARDDHDYKSPRQVVHMLVDCVSRNGNLLLNVGPTAKGEIPAESVERLEAVARWMDANAESIHGCAAAGTAAPVWGRCTRNGNTLYAHVFDKPSGPIPLEGLAGKVRRARVVADGSEVDVTTPWMVRHNTRDAFLTLPGTRLPDPLDTVIAVDLI